LPALLQSSLPNNGFEQARRARRVASLQQLSSKENDKTQVT
jgi:hypothetical protein